MSYEGPEGIFDRRMTFCPHLLSTFDTDELYKTCDHCDMFLCICCPDYERKTLCHHYPVVFIDGACRGNGYDSAVSGIGGTFGERSEWRWSIPVDDSVDSSPLRTNQRAELLAAIEGVRRLGDFLSSREIPVGHTCEMVVATDSEYVSKGVIEWMPKWKRNKWKNSQRKPVSNGDLFRTLDEAICTLKTRRIEVGFWWIDRQFNKRADSLAKAACA